jgi:chemotaxis family two-component system response regulator Rcp1
MRSFAGGPDGSLFHNSQPQQRAIELLLVEDDPGEVGLLRQALADVPLPTRLRVAENGEQALALLRGHRPERDARRPDVILTSLKLPGIDGFQLLAEMKSDPALLAIPVLVFTSSASPSHIRRSYALHANCYLTKPVDAKAFFALVHTIVEFWGWVVELPAREWLGDGPAPPLVQTKRTELV